MRMNFKGSKQRKHLEKKEADNKLLNNPRIPIKYVKEYGVQVYFEGDKLINSADFDGK